jgi:hypothetical protein
MTGDGPDDNKGVVSILENRTRQVINKRVKKPPLSRGLQEELLEDISNNVEEKGGERVSLPEATTALNPPARNTVQKNRSLACGV